MSPRGTRVHCATRTRSHVLRTPFHVTHASCVIRNPVDCLTSTSGHEDILSPTALPASGCGRCGMSTARILSQRVLVLNRAWLPVSVTSVQHALGLLFATHADTGEPKSRFLDVRSLSLIDGADLLLPPGDSPDTLRTPRASVPVPRAIVLSRFIGAGGPPARISRAPARFSRRAVLARDRFLCGYCGKQASLTVDHVIPASRGGPTSFANCVAACAECNARKAARTPKEAGMRLRRGVARTAPSAGQVAAGRRAECARLFSGLLEGREV